MATGLNLPTIPQFVITDGNLDQRWKKWFGAFSYYLLAANIDDAKQKKAMLLHLAGPEVQDVFETFTDPEKKDFDSAVAALKTYFYPRKNLRYERHMFRQQGQEASESMDMYVTKLKAMVKTCEYGTLETDLIVDQIIEKGRDKALRRRLLREDTVTLDSLLKLARAAEASEKHASLMEKDGNVKVKEEIVNRIDSEKKPFRKNTRGQFRKFRGKPQNAGERQGSKPREGAECFRCGRPDHMANECTVAKGKECGFCHKLGHFSKVCRMKNAGGRGRGAKEHVQYVGVSGVEEYDYDSDYSFCVSALANKDCVKVTIARKEIDIMIDSGSTANTINSETWKSLKKRGIVAQPTTTKLYAYGVKEPLKTSGQFVARVSKGNKSVDARFLIVPSGGVSLLSKKTSEDLGLIEIKKEVIRAVVDDDTLMDEALVDVRTELAEKVRKHKKLFVGIGKLKDYELELYVDSEVKPVAQSVRRIPFHIRKQVDVELDRLLAEDIIEPVTGPTEWISPMVPVRKPDGTIRICLDMRAVNQAIKRRRHPLPTMEEVLEEIDGAEVISKLDCRWGYLQIPLRESSRKYTVFVTHRGLFRYKRLFFGVASAPEEYQQIVQTILEECEGTKNSLDDIVVHGKTVAEHDSRLEKVLDVLERHGLTLNLKKCCFGVDKLSFLGHVISKHGISVAEQKVKAVKDAVAPKTETEVRSFLGLVNYCARYIPNFSTLAEPLRTVARKDEVFKWEKSQEDAFQALKEALCKAETLAFFKKHAETCLIVDASPVGLGAVLVQRQSDGFNKPIAYASRTLSQVERRYSQTEKEALAVVWGCERFRIYLIGMPFELITDHKALEIIYSAKSKPSARIERWVLRLQPYEFSIRHKPGSTNIADALSRLLPIGEGKTIAGETERYVHYVLENAVPRAMTLREVEVASRADVEICAVIDGLKNEKRFPKELRQYQLIRHELAVKSGVLLRGTRIVMPGSLRKKVANIAHEGHQGIVRTKQRLREKVWWPAMDNDVKTLIQQCRACQFGGTTEKSEPIKSTVLPKGPWRDLAIDICGPFDDGHSIVVLVDYYSRWPEARVLKSTKAEKLIGWLEHVFESWGLPESITSDNGPQFVSTEFREFMDSLGISHRRVTPYWPQANGQVERLNKCFVKSFRAARVEKKSWKKSLGGFLQAYRSTPHRTTGKSPFELMTTRKMRDKIPQVLQTQKGKLHQEVKAKDALEKEKSKTYTDSRRRSEASPIQVGDSVLISKPRQHKLDTAFGEDIAVVQKRFGNTVLLKLPDGRQQRRSISHVKRFIQIEEEGSEPIDDIRAEAMDQVQLEVDAPVQQVAIPEIPVELRRSERIREQATRLKK